MYKFNKKRKIIFISVIILLIILIIWYVYFYSLDYNFIIENDVFYSKNGNEELIDISQNNVFEDNIDLNEEKLKIKDEDNLITIHIARCCKKRGGYKHRRRGKGNRCNRESWRIN